MRVGLVGLGSIGRRHLGNLLALGADVVAMDVSPEAIEKARSAYPHAHYGDSLPFAGLDALVIATPLDSHLPLVEEAVARRLPFFVEKPLGTLEQLPRWRKIAALDLPVNQVGYNLRFHAAALALKVDHPSPSVGYFNCCSDMRHWPGRGYGSALLEMSHEIDLAMWFGAPTDDVTGWVNGNEAEVEFGPYTDRWRVYLNGTATSYSRWWYVDGEDESFDAASELGTAMYYAEMAHFLKRVRSGGPTRCPLADGLRVLEVCRQIEQVAHETGAA
jgi:predicted dehydrogenase